MRFRSQMLAACVIAGVVLVGLRPPPPSRWQPIGISGGGAMFAPAISPADPDRMMVNCDMSAAYTTIDGGKTWRMIHYQQLRSNIRCRPAYHPTDPNVIFAANGYAGMKVTRDGGISWEKIGNIPGGLRGEIAIHPRSPDFMLAGAGTATYHSNDGGLHWTRCDGPAGEPLSFAFDLNSPGRVCFAATRNGIWRSADGGERWTPATGGLPAREILAFAGGSSTERKATILYCSMLSVVEGGKLTGGIYKSTNGGETWRAVRGDGLNADTNAFDRWAMGPVAQYRQLLTTDRRPETVYAVNSSTGVPPPHHASIYRSDDSGNTWRATFQGDPRYPGCNVERDYGVCEDGQYYQSVPDAAICDKDPDRLVRVDMGNCYVTVDGGVKWRLGHTGLSPGDSLEAGARWRGNGLVVTTTWNYYFDPFRADRRYIAYTDIGFAISDDRGQSWRWWRAKGRAPWRNTCYEIAFDPSTPGKIWGAFSEVHDIPNGNIIWGRHRDDRPGGICISKDFGETWTASSQGLPLAAATSIVVDPGSPAGARTLYAGVFGHGVYRSTDDGNSWTLLSPGPGTEKNRRVCRVFLHRDGTLFALVTGLQENRRFLAEGPGLYRSRDRGRSWEMANASRPLVWPKDFTVDPRDSRTIYLSGADGNGSQEGGLYRTADAGKTWTLLARRGPEHFGGYLHPKRPGWIYMTLTESAPDAGLWLSRDNGATWKAMEGLPFGNAQRVTVDPGDPDTIYVTTFGGSVWRGPAAED